MLYRISFHIKLVSYRGNATPPFLNSTLKWKLNYFITSLQVFKEKYSKASHFSKNPKQNALSIFFNNKNIKSILLISHTITIFK